MAVTKSEVREYMHRAILQYTIIYALTGFREILGLSQNCAQTMFSLNRFNPRTAGRFLLRLQRGCKAAPPVSPERMEICPCGFHQSVGIHKLILSDIFGNTIFQATPTKIKTAAVRPDVNGMP